MIDWGLALKISLGGYGTTIIALVILSLVAWGMGLVLRKSQTKVKGDSKKE